MPEDLAVVHEAGLGGSIPLVSMKVSARPLLSAFGHWLVSTPLAVMSWRRVGGWCRRCVVHRPPCSVAMMCCQHVSSCS